MYECVSILYDGALLYYSMMYVYVGLYVALGGCFLGILFGEFVVKKGIRFLVIVEDSTLFLDASFIGRLMSGFGAELVSGGENEAEIRGKRGICLETGRKFGACEIWYKKEVFL